VSPARCYNGREVEGTCKKEEGSSHGEGKTPTLATGLNARRVKRLKSEKSRTDLGEWCVELLN